MTSHHLTHLPGVELPVVESTCIIVIIRLIPPSSQVFIRSGQTGRSCHPRLTEPGMNVTVSPWHRDSFVGKYHPVLAVSPWLCPLVRVTYLTPFSSAWDGELLHGCLFRTSVTHIMAMLLSLRHGALLSKSGGQVRARIPSIGYSSNVPSGEYLHKSVVPSMHYQKSLPRWEDTDLIVLLLPYQTSLLLSACHTHNNWLFSQYF